MSRGRLALPALLAGACGIGLAPILVRLAGLEAVGPAAAAFWRLALALPFLAAWSRLQAAPPPSRLDAFLLVLAGLFFAADLAFWHESIARTRVANATLLAALASALAALASWALFRDRLRVLVAAGLALAIGGAALLMRGSAGTRHLAGDLLGVLAAVFYAAYLLSVGRLRARCSTAAVMAWSGLGATLGLLAAVGIARERLLPATPAGWTWVAALALLSQLGGQTLIAYALAHLSMAFSAVSLLLQPLVAAGMAWALFGEALGPWQLAGGLLILSGIAAARIGDLPKP